MPNVTLKELAAHAEVSVATVDRVLHERDGVSLKARQRVKEAVQALGYGKLPSRLMSKPYGRQRFLIFLPKLNTGFVRDMITSLREAQNAVTDAEVLVEIERVHLLSGDDLVEKLQRMDLSAYDGVGLFAVDVQGVRDGIDRLARAGIPVVTMVSDMPSSARCRFVGIDNVAAGRTAGRLIGRFIGRASGTVGIIAGSQQIRDHMERSMGFHQILRRDFKNLRVLPILEGDSVAARNRAHVLDLMMEHDDLLGLYCTGGGNSGVISALGDMERRAPCTVLHELTPETRGALQKGLIDAVIGQDPGHIARSTIRQLSAEARKGEVLADQERIRINVFLAENLP